MMRKLMIILVVALMLTLVGCGSKEPVKEPVKEPSAPALEPAADTPQAATDVADELGELDDIDADLSVEGLEDLDAQLADIEDLEI